MVAQYDPFWIHRISKKSLIPLSFEKQNAKTLKIVKKWYSSGQYTYFFFGFPYNMINFGSLDYNGISQHVGHNLDFNIYFWMFLSIVSSKVSNVT